MQNNAKPAEELPAWRLRPERLYLSVSVLALGLALLAGEPVAFAQSVTGTGDVSPGIPAPPLPNWDLGGLSLVIGETGAGALTIADGGTVASTGARIGRSGANSGTVMVTGAGSTWSNAGQLYLGVFDTSTGVLTIASGGKVSTSSILLGTHTGTSGTVNLLGDAVSGRGVLETNVVYRGNGTASLNLDGGILRASASEPSFLHNYAVLAIGANGAFFDSNGHDIGIATSFGGTGGLIKLGAGTLTLSGTSTYTGGTTIAGGKLSVSSDANLGDASGGLTLDGGTLLATGSFSSSRAMTLGSGGGGIEVAAGQTLSLSGSISGSSGLTKSGAGRLTLAGTNTHSGATLVHEGSLAIQGAQALSAASDYSFAAGTRLDIASSLGIVTAGSIAGAGRLEIDPDSTLETGATNASTTFSGMIISSGSLRKVGTGTLTLTGENSYSGGTTIAGGAISIAKESNLGSTSGALTLDGGVLQVTGTGLADLSRAIVLGSNGGGFDIAEAGHIFTVTQSFSGAGGLSKAGAGTLVLSGTHDYSGATTVLAGRLVGDSASAFSANSDFTIAAGAVLEAVGGAGVYEVGSLAGAGEVAIGTGSVLVTGSTNVTTTFSGSFSGGGSLEYNGTGTQIFTGTGSLGGGLSVCSCAAGSGSFVIRGGSLTLGDFVMVSSGTLVVDQGGSLDNGSNGFLVRSAVRIDGAGTRVTTGDTFVQGFFDPATISISGGATLTSRASGFGPGPGAGIYGLGASASVLVTGAGSRWSVDGGLEIGGFGGTFAASVTVADGGALVLSSGDVAIDAFGTLNLGAGGKAGTVQLDAGIIRNDGSIVADFTDSTTLAATIDGAGSLTKRGTGTLTLSGTNTYTGGTTIAGGAVSISSEANLGDTSSALTLDGGVLQVTGTTLTELARNIVLGAGGGGFDIADAGNSFTVAQALTGLGGLIKAGAGTLTLTGASTYSGGTTVAAGKLVVNGTLASAVTVNGGVLGGSGTVGGIAVAGGGTVAPGNSIGTLNVAGNVAFAAGSTYQLEINAAGQSDRINATGLATLSGGTVQVLAAAGNYAAGTSYTILTAAGGISGQFAGVSSNFAFLTPTLNYGGQGVTLTMTRNDTGFGPDAGGGGGTGGGGGSGGSGGGGTSGGSGGGASPRPYVAQTRNQGFIANAAERLGVGNPVYDTLVSATAAEARAGFDLLSGEAHAQGVAVAVGESRLVREAVLGRLRGSLLPVPGGEIAAGFSADLPSAKGPVVMPAPRLDERFTLWGEAFGAHANTDGDGNAASLSRRTGGAVVGADMKLYDSGLSSLRVGIAGGYTRSDFDVDARLSSGRLESGHVLLYAGARHGNWRLDGGVGYSFGETNLTRQVRIRGFGDTLRSERDTDVLQAFAELGYAFRFQSFALEPFAQIALLRVSSGSAIEQGGAAALRVASQDQSLGFTTLGLRAEAQLGAMPLFARGLVGWRYGFGDLTPQALTGFVVGTAPARVYAAQIDRNALVAEAGLDWRATASTTLGLGYSAAIGERTRDHALKGRLEVRF
ncbi:hypothetical protein DK26_15550 [Bosea sp. WAO]|uniref:autotransporter domain-containing protein n=1 Tax=Bosea sp. WAO TaxID=406341 RepID=UPI00074660B3|nr:autotransporter domain-containing protein [Bosea sp. WAO]KUL94403.1 hypothetical protein DK26_15550 [Bosea sp. WAO]